MHKRIEDMTEDELVKHLESLKQTKYDLECNRKEVTGQVEDITNKVLDEYKPINQ
jgi:hypothetical protein